MSRWRDANGNVRDNHNTFNAFAKIVGLVPTQAVTIDDIDLIPAWLEGKIYPSAVAFALAGGTLQRFLNSAAADDWKKACRIVRQCTALQWVDDKFHEEKKPATAIQDYWVKEIVKRTAAQLGTKLGEEAVALFIERAKQAYSQSVAQRYSYISRAAVEDHPQNHSWRGPENWSVDGLRDSLLSWVDRDAPSAQSFIEPLYQDEAQIIRRVAIYVLDARFELLRTAYPNLVGPAFFTTGHLHELYNLIKNHFADFTDSEKTATVAAIRMLPKSETADDPDRLLKHLQRQWLSAIVNSGSAEVDRWYQELSADHTLGGLSPHPSFMSYMESRWGHGPIPYPVQELIIFAKEGTIVDRLNSFTQEGSWSGPSTRSLVDTLVEAIAAEPSTFLAALGSFLTAKRAYQYGLISGFKKVWDAAADMTAPIDWNNAWPALIEFFQTIIRPDEFWIEEVTESDVLTPTRDWIPTIISEFLRAGVRNDTKAYAPDLLPKGFIQILVDRSEKQSEADPSGAMDKAINSPKGIAIEALIDHALRSCRVSDAANGQHSDVWDGMATTFNEQLAQCRNDNYEFSTLAGAYITNIHYMSTEWCEGNFASIFPKEYPSNCLSAIDGLAWAPPSGPIFQLLLVHGIIGWGLRNIPQEYRARENIFERVALAYLWEIEPLTSDHFSYIFGEKLFDDLQRVAEYFWSVCEQPLSDRQKALIIDFWYECVTRTRDVVPSPAPLLSTLSRLSSYLTSVGQREKELLLAVAPHVGVNYNADQFIEELDRLADENTVEVSGVLDEMLKAYKPDYDFEDRFKNLLRKLANCESTRIDALRLAEQLVGRLPGMVEFYEEITSLHPALET